MLIWNLLKTLQQLTAGGRWGRLMDFVDVKCCVGEVVSSLTLESVVTPWKNNVKLIRNGVIIIFVTML